MNANLKTFCKAVGIRPEVMEKLISDDPGEGFDVQAAANEYREIQSESIKQELLPDLKKSINSEATAKLMQKFMSDVNKKFSLGYTREELSHKDYDEFLLEFNEKNSQAIDAASASGDQSLKDRIEELKAKNAELTESITSINSEYESRIQEKENELRTTISDMQFTRAFNSVQLGIKPEHRPIWEKALKEEAYQKVNVSPDGRISDKMTGGKVMNSEKNGTIETIDELVQNLVHKHGIAKENNGGTGVEPTVHNTGAPGKGSRAEAMKKRIAAQGVKI